MIKVLTLFGEEIIPEELNVAPKRRGRQRAADVAEGAEGEETEPTATTDAPKEEKPIAIGALERARKEINPVVESEKKEEPPVEEPTEQPVIPEVEPEKPVEEEAGIIAVEETPVSEVANEPANVAPVEDANVINAEPLPAEAPATERIKDEITPVAEKATAQITPAEQIAEEPVPTVARKKRPIKKARGKNIIPNLSEPVILKDWTATKQYYPIGEVAELFNVATSHIRYWTNEFGIRVRTTKKGDRMYSADHIQMLRTIYHLTKERGFTLAGAKTKLKEDKKPVAQTTDISKSLLQLRKHLLEIRDQLA